MNSIIDKIKDLRSITGLSIADCKKALVNNNMDIEKAAKDLKILGLNKASLKSQRSTASGQVSLLISKEKKTAVISEVNCETDFVAKSKDFLIFNDEINNYLINEKNIVGRADLIWLPDPLLSSPHLSRPPRCCDRTDTNAHC